MTYQETLDYLYSCLPVFEHRGAGAYKPGLDNTLRLAEFYGNPQNRLRCIHVAGTNGKGSVSSTLAAVMTAAGYRTGLYTSPHLLDFGERICVDGKPLDKQFVVDFVQRWIDSPLRESLQPTFFEFATVMAFCWFEKCGVDVAVIEAGLGGRLDSTNIITPILSIITNISLDHTALLGTTPAAIAAEKGGIIKDKVPVVIGAADKETRKVFTDIANRRNAPIVFAQDLPLATIERSHNKQLLYKNTPWGNFAGELKGEYQKENTLTVLAALVLLSADLDISPKSVHEGFANVSALSGLKGRWMKIEHKGVIFICDTGHNLGAWEYLGPALEALAEDGTDLRMVIGFVADKDLEHIVRLMPRNARYWFAAPSTPRARQAESTASIFNTVGIDGTVCGSVAHAVALAADKAKPNTIVYVGGSTFVVSDFLKSLG